MSELLVTSSFVKKLAKNIRQKYGVEPSHTEVLELVAEALGWKAGPLMHALKAQGVSKPDVSRDFLVYKHTPVDPIPEMIRNAISLHKLRVLKPEQIAEIMNFSQAATGILLIVADKLETGTQYAASIAKDWQVRLSDMVFGPYQSTHSLLPIIEGLGTPTRTLAHVATAASSDAGARERFVLLQSVASPLNLWEGIEAGKRLPTILVVARAAISEVTGIPKKPHANGLQDTQSSEAWALLNGLRSLTSMVLDAEIIGGRFYRANLSNWADWEKLQALKASAQTA